MLLSSECGKQINIPRKAFIVGNAKYTNYPSIDGARKDINNVMEILMCEGGFRKVTVGGCCEQHHNVSSEAFWNEFRNFRKQLNKGDDVLLYFSGHAVLSGGKTYLLPTDAQDTLTVDNVRSCISLDELVTKIAQREPRLKIFCIDACADKIYGTLPHQMRPDLIKTVVVTESNSPDENGSYWRDGSAGDKPKFTKQGFCISWNEHRRRWVVAKELGARMPNRLIYYNKVSSECPPKNGWLEREGNPTKIIVVGTDKMLCKHGHDTKESVMSASLAGGYCDVCGKALHTGDDVYICSICHDQHGRDWERHKNCPVDKAQDTMEEGLWIIKALKTQQGKFMKGDTGKGHLLNGHMTITWPTGKINTTKWPNSQWYKVLKAGSDQPKTDTQRRISKKRINESNLGLNILIIKAAADETSAIDELEEDPLTKKPERGGRFTRAFLGNIRKPLGDLAASIRQDLSQQPRPLEGGIQITKEESTLTPKLRNWRFVVDLFKEPVQASSEDSRHGYRESTCIDGTIRLY